eukprot:CAMPEP_0183704678 /NCGR_PEP_ID=MMETSP0737-20130205/1967_1 /TAXON_ID=385413 /ORGANISM="Thalassiosira miniscula, Strain CCMP1093" /LENGTH=726 /DNA_ID=CAMNT_0025931639 /DNA_START=166 /DNA_END=2346 /DNA_ORIENTATION=-
MKPKKGASDGQALAADNVKAEKPSKSEKRSKKDKDKKSKQSRQQQDKSNNSSAAALPMTAGSDSALNGQSNNANAANGQPNIKKGTGAKKRTIAFHGGRPPQLLDPLLLARGMSSRCLSNKISHRLAPLSKESIERDLRHMEAHRNACNGYNQQLFVFKNQELVRSGYFGTFAPFPGAEGDDGTRQTNSAPSAAPMASTSKSGAFSMPIKIDPEEEKRLSLLRKKIHQSEFEREKLETEYLSLRAHYVHESQLVRKTRTYEMGRWKLLRELTNRRAHVLALMRVRAAIGRDVETLLKHRGELAEKVKTGEIKADGDGKAGAMEITNGDKNGASIGNSKKAGASGKAADLVEIWNSINAQLKEAELACTEIETPSVLSQMVMGSVDQSNGSNPAASRSRSPMRNEDKGKSRKRSSSVTSAEEAATTGNNNDLSSSITSNTNNNHNAKKSHKSPIPPGLEPHVIPWDCVVEPQTPFEVPLLLSCLSTATDKCVGYVSDKTNPTAITWLEATLPESLSAYDADVEDLTKLRDEVGALEDELKCESDRNTELQKQLIASRSRNDEMVAMMQLLRSETEAVLERHNLIMETPEARAKSAELHNKLLEQEKLNNPSADAEEEEEEEGEVDENEDLSSGEEEIHDDDDEEDRSDDDSVGIKEITVDKDSNNVGPGESDDEDDDASEEGEIAEGDDVEEDDEPTRKTKRRPGADDEESSGTPPNTSAYRKRRRY